MKISPFRKAFRDEVTGKILTPRDMTDEEFTYALSLHTQQERESLAKDVNRMLKWTVWQLKHPRLASVLDALIVTGMNASRPFLPRVR